MKHIKKYRTVILVALTLVAWSAIFYFIPSDSIVERVGGERHAYLIAFAISLFAGFSSLTGGTAYATVIEFARGGADPLILGLAGGLGLFLSDSAFYLLVMRGRDSIKSRFKKFLEKAQQFLERMPLPVTYLAIYLFCAFGPIPNDIILGVLMVSGFQYRKLWPVLLAGDVTLMLFLTHVFTTSP